jgi:hypothetical protein
MPYILVGKLAHPLWFVIYLVKGRRARRSDLDVGDGIVSVLFGRCVGVRYRGCDVRDATVARVHTHVDRTSCPLTRNSEVCT